MRVEGWEEKLSEYLERCLSVPFQWGSFDCVTFACECSRIICGKHPWPELVGTYHDKQGAQDIIDRIMGTAGGTVTLFMERSAQKCGFRMIPAKTAMRGDWVIYLDEKHGPTAGVVSTTGAVFPSLEAGLTLRPISDCAVAWRVQ